VDWNYAPSSLDAKLLEEGGGDYSFRGGKSIWEEKSATDYADYDDREATTKDLRAIANDCATRHGPEVGYDLSYGYSIGAEVVLILQHGWIQILGSVRLM
jgi:hypothetical protein